MRRMAALDRTAGDMQHAGEIDAQADRIAGQVIALRQLLDDAA
jgi:hypothetical protein